MIKVKDKAESMMEDKELRKEYLNRLDVLEKVKELVLLPNTELMTTKMVADWYDVSEEVLRKLYERNKDELNNNGVVSLSGTRLRDIKSLSGLRTRARVVNVYSKRALLNVGMLLRDSLIAKRVRAALLDQQEELTDEEKTKGIDKEKEIALRIMFSNSDEEKMLAFNDYRKYKNRHIEKLEFQIEKQKPQVNAWDQFINSNSTYTFRDVAKMISTKASEEKGSPIKITNIALTRHLREIGVLSKNKSGKAFLNNPNKDYEDYFNVTSTEIKNKEANFSKTTTRVKPNGVEFIYNLLSNERFKLK